VRRIPEHFSWLDHRLVRDGHIDILSHQAAALYLFLVTVADSQGLSYYSDASLMSRLSMAQSMLESARRELVLVSLVCFKKPLYQVLALDRSAKQQERGLGGPMSLREILASLQEVQP
jgi:hypothetical protein